MKKAIWPRFAVNFKGIAILATVIAIAFLGLASFKTGAQQQEQYPYQEFLYNGLPYNDAFPPAPENDEVINAGTSIHNNIDGKNFHPLHKTESGNFLSKMAYRVEAQQSLSKLMEIANLQPAIFTTTGTVESGSSNKVVAFPDPRDAQGTQNIIPGLPADAAPQGAAFYGSDNALIADSNNNRIHVIQVSAGSLVSTINTAAAGYNGMGTIAVAPNLTSALAMGANNSLAVIQAPFGPASPITSINLPGPTATWQTQAIVFNNAGRAFVYHSTGITVLDSPYTSIAFTIPVTNPVGGAIAITPDGNTLLATNFSGNQVRIFQAPFTSASTPTLLTIAGGVALNGIMVTPDGTRAIVVSGHAHHAAAIAAPFNSTSVVESLSLPPGNDGFEDVGISADSQLAFLAGRSYSEPPVLIKAPFTAAGATSANVPIVGVTNPNRGAGSARFMPPGLAPGLTVSQGVPATAGSGGNLTYTINYANTGRLNATNVVITNPLPANTTFVSASDGGVLDAGRVALNGGAPETANVVWNIGTVNAGDMGSVSFTVTVNAPLGSTINNFNYTISADGVAPIAGPPAATQVTNGASTIMAVPVARVQGTSGSATIANVNDAEDAENNLVVSVVGPTTVNGVTVSGISVNVAGVVTATVAASCTATNASFTLQVTDSGMLSATDTLNVTVTPETTPPVINPIANVVATLPPNTMATSMPVSFPLPTATDNCSAVTVTTSPVSGSVFNVGTTTVNVTATDANGNTSNATFTVTVQYNFTGFGGRVNNPPAVNFASAGNTLPITFSLSGFKGYNIFAPGSPSSQQVNCMTGTPIGPSSPISMPLGMYYSPDTYTLYWQTNSAWAGTCRTFSMTLNDGTTRTLNFRFYN